MACAVALFAPTYPSPSLRPSHTTVRLSVPVLGEGEFSRNPLGCRIGMPCTCCMRRGRGKETEERGRGRDFLSLNGNRHVPARPTPARPPARPRVVRWGCAAGHAAECGEHTARSLDRRPRLCLNIWARNDTKWAGGRRNDGGIPKKEAGLARAESEVIERRRSAIPVVYCRRGFALAFEGESRVCSVFLSVCLSVE